MRNSHTSSVSIDLQLLTDMPAREILMQITGRGSYNHCPYCKHVGYQGYKYIYTPFKKLIISKESDEENYLEGETAVKDDDVTFPKWNFRTHNEYLEAMDQIVRYSNYDWADQFGV